MAINFPDVSALSDGYQEIIDGKLYTLNKTSDTVFYWSASLATNPDDRYVNITGDNMTGALGGVTDFAATNVEATNLTDGTETKSMSDVLDGFATEVLIEAPTGTGNSIFTGTIIPANARRIIVLFNKIKTNGAQNLLARFRTTLDGSVTTGYDSVSIAADTGLAASRSGIGFIIRRADSTQELTGKIEFNRMGPTSSTWVSNHMIHDEGNAYLTYGSGILNSYNGDFNEIALTTTSNSFQSGTISVFVST